MNLSWGTKIIIAFSVFMVGTIAMVFFVVNLKIDMVEDNYYEKELKYQDEIKVLSSTKDLKKPLNIKYTGENISFDFPEQNTLPTGEIHFYRPSDAAKDFKVSIGTDENRTQYVGTADMAQGMWKVQVTWYAGNNKYFTEETIYIN